MAEFQPLDLGRIIQTAEVIKGMRRQAQTDSLRDAYLGQQMKNAQAQEERASTEFKDKRAEVDAKRAFHVSDAVYRSENPVDAVRNLAPDFIAEYDQAHGQGSFDQLPPERVKEIFGYTRQSSAAKAGFSLNGTPEQQFAADQANKGREQTFSNSKELADIQHKYSMEEIAARGEIEKDKAATTNDRKTFRDIQSLRKEFEGMDAVKNYRLVLPLYERAAKAPNTRAGDISIVYALGKMFDPASVVREGELILSKDAAPWLRKIVTTAQSQVTGQGAIDKQTRADILQAMRGQVDAFAAPYEQERSRFSGYAQENGWAPDQVVGASSPAAAFDQGQPRALTPEEAAKLPPGTRFLGQDGVTRVKH